MEAQNGQNAKEAYLAELRAQVERLNALIAAVESEGEVLSGDSAAPSGGRIVGESQVRPDTFYGMSTPKGTRTFLEMTGKGNPQTPQAIAAALVRGGQEKPENLPTVLRNVYTALKRGRTAGEFVKIAKEWGLAEWYPKPKGNEDGAKPKSRKTRKRSKKRKTAKKREKAKPPAKQRSAYHAYISKRAKEGLTVGQAAVEWREMKARGES